MKTWWQPDGNFYLTIPLTCQDMTDNSALVHLTGICEVMHYEATEPGDCCERRLSCEFVWSTIDGVNGILGNNHVAWKQPAGLSETRGGNAATEVSMAH